MKRDVRKLPVPNIVETFELGNTTIHIADNEFSDKSPEQINEVWKDFYTIGWQIWNNTMKKNTSENDHEN